MAGYVYLKDGNRTKRHRFIIHRKGVPAYSQSFVDKKAGEAWARDEERSIENTGKRTGIEQLRTASVRETIQRYLDEVTPTKANDSEAYVLKRLLDQNNHFELVKKSLAGLTKQDGHDYIAKRKKDGWRGAQGNWKTSKPITPRTIAREIVVLRHVFNFAMEEWGYPTFTNPFARLKHKGAKHRRKRRLQPGELEKLQEASKKCLGLNRIYVPLAMYLAIETGMRLDEIFNLTWQDLDFDKRRIEVVKSKTDDATGEDGRTIVMTAMAMLYASRLPLQLDKAHGKFSAQPTDLIFPMTKDAFEQSFDDVLDRAKIKPDRRGERLQFRDLRREAGSRFDEAELSKAQNELMLGHQGKDTNSIYIASELKKIQDKLDRFQFEGKTLAEVELLPMEEQIVLLHGAFFAPAAEGERRIAFPAG